jgi:hypothetical protein
MKERRRIVLYGTPMFFVISATYGLAQCSTIAGGCQNNAGAYATVGGGWQNIAQAYATVGGGWENDAGPDYSTIGGGKENSINPYGHIGSTICGGLFNRITSGGGLSAIGGGALNELGGIVSTIGGGILNRNLGDYSNIAGGENNYIDGGYSCIGGGSQNRILPGAAKRNYSVIAGGSGNSMYESNYAAIGGGRKNSIEGHYATVSGGRANLASQYATVPGGRDNVAFGEYSFAAGRRATVWRSDAGTFIWADSTDADFRSTGPNQFLVRASGGTALYSNSAATVGVRLAAGSNSWSVISDRNLKENITPIDPREILQRVADLPITIWNLQSQTPAIRHIGPMAQDFHALFGIGESDTHITTIDADGVALAAIQGLHQIVQEKECEIDELRARNAELESRLAKIEQMLAGQKDSR